MKRFYVDPPGIQPDHLAIAGPLAHRLSRVLRLQPGDEIALFDGQGSEAVARIVSVGQRTVEATIIERRAAAPESPVRVHVYQCITKGERFEWLVEKATELGVHAVTPLVTARSVVKARGEGNRSDRWRRIAVEAAEQCGRGAVPLIGSPLQLEAALGAAEGILLLPYEAAPEHELSIATALQRDIDALFALSEVSVFIGPEGGYEPAEVERAQKAGAVVVTMGRRVLRSETAGLVALTLVMQAVGELG